MLISPDTLRVQPSVFAEVMKETNHTWRWDAKLTRYSPSATCVTAKVVKVTNHSGLWDAKLAWYSASGKRPRNPWF